jgi:4-amino-4-deoxy-L-arabinose transferase-like glycosyltransferase
VLLVLFCARELLAMRVDGATVDEPTHLAYGERALASGTFRREHEAHYSVPASVLNAIPVALANRGQAISWRQRLFIARLPTVLLGACLGWLVWRWALQLFGAWSGMLALFLYTFCPNVLAHAHLVTTDVATALAMFAATYCLWRYVTQPSRGRLLAAAAVFGAAQLTKATALFLVPVFALLLGARALRSALDELRSGRAAWQEAGRVLARQAARCVSLLALFGVAAMLALDLGFWFEGTGTPLSRFPLASPALRRLAAVPVVRDLPLPLPAAYVQGLDMVSQDTGGGTWSYLRGRYSQTGFRSYFFWSFLVKVPLATQLLLVIACCLWAAGKVRASGADSFLLVPPLLLFLYLSLLFQLDVGFRYLLPALPFLFVFASRAAAPAAWGPAVPAAGPVPAVWPAPAGWQPAVPAAGEPAAPRPLWRWLVAAALLVWLAAASALAHPHYIPYFNELAGGPANGWRWLIDSNLDWGQDAERVREVYAARSPVRVLFDPSGPVAGRVAVGLSRLVGHDPGAARRHAWLRDNFRPIATFGHSWEVFDVTERDLARCCAGLPRAWVLDDLDSDLALAGEPFGGGEGVATRFEERLNDGMLGANEPVDAARTLPPRPQPVRAWFGISWPAPETIGRVVAFPSFESRGPTARKFLAIDYVFQFWDGARWCDIPGTRVFDNRALRVEHRFSPLRTSRIRLLVERERNELGNAELTGGFRAACLELAAYPP